jgi:hypothetical protein
MTLLNDLRGYARFAAGLHGYLKHPLTLDEGRRIALDLQSRRGENFLRLMGMGVFGYPDSPYMRLMQHAGIAPEEVRAMIAKDGLETALRALYAAGVYVTYEEYKGRKPIVRGSLTLHVSPADFENPHTLEYYTTTTSGTTGAGTRISQDLEFQRMIGVLQNLGYEAHGVYHVPTALWRGILPDGSGVNNTLKLAAFGHVPEAWFSPNKAEPFKPGYLKYAVASYLLVVASRAYGIPVAWPEYVPLDRAEVVARWAEKVLRKNGCCFIMTTASRGLRVGLAALKAGIDLTGTVFAIAGEPVTQARVDGILRAGGRVFTTYGTAEAGRIGMGCANPANLTDMHVFQGMFEVHSQPVETPGFSDPVPAICMTSLHPSSPFIFVNYLSDDYGVIEERDCGCSLGDLGLTQHIHSIFSYSKLTGEGVTLAGSEMLHMLEHILPEKFGGSLLDYQLEETEDAAGFIRMNLIISPRVEIHDEQAVIDEMMRHFQHSDVGGDVAQAMWRQANTIRIVRAEPVASERGKHVSIRKLKRV